MRFYRVVSVLGWVLIAVWVVRFSMGLDHFSKDQIPVMLVCGPVGGLAAWYVVTRQAKERAAAVKR